MERTLVIIKPDGVQRGLIGTIVDRFERRGLRLVAMKFMQISTELAGRHYAVHQGKPFYESLISYITSGPVLVMVLEANDAIAIVRTMMGSTRPAEAQPGTIRGDFGLEVGRNIVHGSDSVCPSGPPPAGEVNNCDLPGDNVKAAVADAALDLAGIGDLIVHEPVWTNRSTPANPSPGDASTGTNARGEYVTVFLDFVYEPLIGAVVEIPFLPDITISAESTLVINY